MQSGMPEEMIRDNIQILYYHCWLVLSPMHMNGHPQIGKKHLNWKIKGVKQK